MTLDQLKTTLAGTWRSLAPEIRPSKSPDGTLKPFYLTRRFTYHAGDRFELAVTNYADPAGKVAVATLELAGHMAWRGEHSIAPGAFAVDFTADDAYAVTPLVPPFAELLNKVASDGYAPWAVGATQSVLGKSFAPFGLVAGTHFKEYDLTYVAHDLLFWGARNVDGRGFDSEANRPTNLQIPMQRASRHA
jgi:hypothetical protein|nr:hypothetical protein [Kofleriaceae bacterium]